MIGLDMYFSSLSQDERIRFKHKFALKTVQTMPLMSWDVFSVHHFNKLKAFKREQDIAKVLSLAKKFNWKTDINSIFEGNPCEAIVVTDLHKKIIWVNDGFSDMTGYSKKDALDQTPTFLQGSQTSLKAKERFRAKLSGIEPFTEVITNYKRNNEPYNCEVKVFPLFNNEKTHYIALERQVV